MVTPERSALIWPTYESPPATTCVLNPTLRESGPTTSEI